MFDQDYVLVKRSDTQVLCLHDACPHKAASLSQGRVTCSGLVQCSYHGWSFNGTTGACVEIPQLVKGDSGNSLASQPRYPSASQAQAVPAQIHQEMIWIFPGGPWEQALVAPPPPSVPEYGVPGYRLITPFVRDFPHVDWSILLSNICDADHGLFAHQAKGFDLYSASSQYPMAIGREEFPQNGKGWKIQVQVPANYKVLQVDQELRGTAKQPPTQPSDQMATTTFVAPSFVQQKRVNRTESEAATREGRDDLPLSAASVVFFICPVGAGRSRFMSALVFRQGRNNFLFNFMARRWIPKLALDNFLDQDTYLLATQQQYILGQEAKDLKQTMAATNNNNNEIPMSLPPSRTRRNLFCLCSPTEKLGARMEQFWDATLWKSPNRPARLLQLEAAGTFASTPPRSIVLDRQTQQLEICSDSQDVVRNCQRLRTLTRTMARVTALASLVLLLHNPSSDSLLSRMSLVLPRPVPALGRGALLKWLVGGTVVSWLVSRIADKIQGEFFFKYTNDMRQRDLKKIPKQIWMDRS